MTDGAFDRPRRTGGEVVIPGASARLDYAGHSHADAVVVLVTAWQEFSLGGVVRVSTKGER